MIFRPSAIAPNLLSTNYHQHEISFKIGEKLQQDNYFPSFLHQIWSGKSRGKGQAFYNYMYMVFKFIILNDLPEMELISSRGEASLCLMVMWARWQSISQLGAGMALPVIIHVTLAGVSPVHVTIYCDYSEWEPPFHPSNVLFQRNKSVLIGQFQRYL